MYVIRLPAVYTVEAMISIVPPQSDPEFTTLVSKNGPRRDSIAQERYFQDRVNRIKSKDMADRVVSDPTFLQSNGLPPEEAAEELMASLTVQPIRNSTYV